MKTPTIVLVIPCALAVALADRQTAAVDFQREVRPLLSDNCFQCHGPDSSTRMAGLRLDKQEAAFGTRKNGVPIVPGKPSESMVFQRITAENAARRMPPRYSHKSLTDQQISRIKLWIEQGAKWKQHWAYQSPKKTPAPAVRDGAWARNEIDRFILSKLEAIGLGPAPQADPRTLIRRAALDLTGLPPTPAEIDKFLQDKSPQAYERMLDRYLASPHFGEQRARYWLDAARYGDTHGIHVDNYREIWPYRDWVIQAFNRNQPFDQFVTEQLAGDLLPNSTLDQRIATGFVRCGATTNEAGIIEAEYAEIYAKDRADTMGAVFLGLTVGCATCHDHKFDPITQRDFYSLGAFFRNTTQGVMDGNIPDPPPVVVVPRADDRSEWDEIATRKTAIRNEMKDAILSGGTAFEQWLGRDRKPAIKPLPDNSEIFAADLSALSKGKNELRFETNEGIEFPKAPRLDADKPFSISVNFYFPEAEQVYIIAEAVNPKDKGRGWTLRADTRVLDLRLTGDGGRSIEVKAGYAHPLHHGTWNQAVISYDGSKRRKGMTMYLNGQRIPTQGGGLQNVEITGGIGVDNPLVLGKALAHGAISDFRILNRVVGDSEALVLSQWPIVQAASAKPAAELTSRNREALQSYFLLNEYKPFQLLAREQNDLELKSEAIARRGATSLVLEERTDSKPSAHILYRGAYDQKREKVEANTPSLLPPMTSSMPRNRLGFAQWLFTSDQPLTSRVTVNRIWQEIFGTGIVKTTEDFGSQGEPPSHQLLLDWLAVDFREHGWDLKRFYKQILMSAAYRQSAQATSDKIAKDPENRLLSRGPRFRLDGEIVRDYALAVSGLLSPQIGGPSVKPYQPEGVWEAVAMNTSNTRFYKQDHDDGLYRRSLYTFWKRSAPPASMEIFNAPAREFCTVRRERTDTPLQALVTMNDVQFMEAARTLAERVLQSASEFGGQLEFLSTRLLARSLTPAETAIARRSFEEFQAFYEAHPDEAAKLLSAGQRKPDPALPPADYAAMTMLANQMFNLDEVLNK